MKLDAIRTRLAAHAPDRAEILGRDRASVALVLRDGAVSAELLLIERARREGDPWSGHMALPGGRLAPEERSSRVAAARETFEEVGLDLTDAEYLGRLDDRAGNPRVSPRLLVSAHAFHLPGDPPLRLDPREVQTAFWFPLADLHDESRHVEHVIPQLPDVRFPGIVVGRPDRHVVWGLTLRILDHLLQVVDDPFRRTWGDTSRFRGV
ncbi:MAG: CoA pyrophosphatase [Myxococcota bacterium]|nr:CoA pyrophosphatase [Myxococcales bacterium]